MAFDENIYSYESLGKWTIERSEKGVTKAKKH